MSAPKCGICRREKTLVGESKAGSEIWCCLRCDRRPRPKKRARIVKRRPDK